MSRSPKHIFASFIGGRGHNRVSPKWMCAVSFIALCTKNEGWRALNLVHKTTWPTRFGWSLEELSSLGQNEMWTGQGSGVFGFETGWDIRGRKWFWGVLHKQIRIKVLNPRQIYFHYLQDWNKNTIKLVVHRQAMWDYQLTGCKNLSISGSELPFVLNLQIISV